VIALEVEEALAKVMANMQVGQGDNELNPLLASMTMLVETPMEMLMGTWRVATVVMLRVAIAGLFGAIPKLTRRVVLTQLAPNLRKARMTSMNKSSDYKDESDGEESKDSYRLALHCKV